MTDDVLITADAHVGETTELRDRLPEEMRGLLTLLVDAPDGDLYFEVGGKTIERPSGKTLSARDRELEFRSDPSRGTDLERRRRDMAREGVDAQVIFPNIALDGGGAESPSEFTRVFARAYNDYVTDVFSPEPQRFKPAAMLPTDAIEDTLAEANRALAAGFATFFLPCVVPWQPYRLKVWEPLWSLAEEAGVPVTFHVFSGNLSFGGEFGDVSNMTDERRARAGAPGRENRKHAEQLDTVAGMAAGMAPILELTSSAVLERHPGLRFVITESECGWLAWTLQAMDQMHRRRHLYRKDLPLRPSEYFKRQGFVTITDDPVALNNLEFVGADRLLWGNDYPHDEGTWPESQAMIDAIRAAMPPQSAQQVLAGNAAELYGFDLDYLAAHKSLIRPASPAP
jgi:predicted TIM-barrel fold metal-dependent hydrolase